MLIGLETARAFLETVKKKHSEISYSDLWILASYVALEVMNYSHRELNVTENALKMQSVSRTTGNWRAQHRVPLRQGRHRGRGSVPAQRTPPRSRARLRRRSRRTGPAGGLGEPGRLPARENLPPDGNERPRMVLIKLFCRQNLALSAAI